MIDGGMEGWRDVRADGWMDGWTYFTKTQYQVFPAGVSIIRFVTKVISGLNFIILVPIEFGYFKNGTDSSCTPKGQFSQTFEMGHFYRSLQVKIQ